MIPTQDEICDLAPWARVALAARCARRVLPFFARWDLAIPAEVDLAEEAIALAAEVAAGAPLIPRRFADKRSRLELRKSLLALEAKYRLRSGVERSPVVAVWAAAHCAHAAIETIDAEAAAGAYSAYCAVYFAWIALEVPVDPGVVGCPIGKRALADDARFAGDRFRADDIPAEEPVRPGSFGPLWPRGVPAWSGPRSSPADGNIDVPDFWSEAPAADGVEDRGRPSGMSDPVERRGGLSVLGRQSSRL